MIRSQLNRGIAMLHDLVAASVAWWIAYLLRFNFELPPDFRVELMQTMVWVVPLQAFVFWAFRLYQGIWRFASVADLRRILFAVLAATALIPLMLGLFRVHAIIPRSVLVMDPLLLLLMMGGSRLLYRLWKENLLYGDFQLRGEPVLVLGAGDAGVSLSKELARSSDWHLVGFLDDDPSKRGRTLNGFKVHGKLDELSHWVERFGVSQIIIAMPSASHQVKKHVIDLASQSGVKALTVPGFDDLLNGRVAISKLRAVELDDLLGRDAVELDDAGLHAQLTGQVVLVTGAGGSIGSELCRQIAHFGPKTLVLYDAGEFALYNIEQELSKHFQEIDIVYLAGDVRDLVRLNQVFSEYLPSVVFHAAAYKHVPLMERHNAWQAVRNNVFGTWQVATCALEHGAEKFVLISTDKAVNPTNVMGTTKRMAEMLCQGLQSSTSQASFVGRDSSRFIANSVGMNPDLKNQSDAECAAASNKPNKISPLQASDRETKFVIVRFGNVLGSNGSVIPKFREQLAKGGPITVTHPEITRFFMSIPEAAQLVMQAGFMGKGGEIFVLDMGQPMKIVDLAKDLIRLSGFSEDDIKIEFSGLRPGEKLYEELLADDESTLPTPHPKLRIARARSVADEEFQALLDWVQDDIAKSDDEVRLRLRQWVPEYIPTSNGH